MVAVAPWWLVYAFHVGAPTELLPTGFVQFDMAYYAAMGRELGERGTLWRAPNPFDTSAHPPPLYFSLFFQLMRLGAWTQSPGVVLGVITVVCGVLMARVTWALVMPRLIPDKSAVFCFALSLWTFSPNFLAHAGLMTTDLPSAVAGMAATYVFWRWLKQPLRDTRAICGEHQV